MQGRVVHKDKLLAVAVRAQVRATFHGKLPAVGVDADNLAMVPAGGDALAGQSFQYLRENVGVVLAEKFAAQER
ncbi:MAG: hypothetical protein L0Y72_21425 [Gemmataceae bacterium]|nr:hypothetical protein [Gemmataceae bacterium]